MSKKWFPQLPTALPQRARSGISKSLPLPALLGGNYYPHFEEGETEAQRLTLMEGQLRARCLLIRHDSL